MNLHVSQYGTVAISINTATNFVSTKDINFLALDLQLAFEECYYTFALVVLYAHVIHLIFNGLKLTYYVK